MCKETSKVWLSSSCEISQETRRAIFRRVTMLLSILVCNVIEGEVSINNVFEYFEMT